VRVLIPTRLAPEGMAILKSTPRLSVISKPGLDVAGLSKALADADAVIIRSEHQFNAKLIKAAPQLRLIARAGVGVENVDLAAATARGIVVLNAPGANSIAVAELAMALMMALFRRIHLADRSLKDGAWDRSLFAGHELSGKVLGLVGFGRIGREVALRARAFGMDVIAYDPFITPAAAQAADISLVKLPELLTHADVVSLHLPLTDQTRHIIGAAQLKRMKPGAYVINTARGGIIDEGALKTALQRGTIAGCALDVFEHEPPNDRWFAGMDNVIVTPHLGAATTESQTKVSIEIAQAVCRALLEGIYQNAVNLPVGDISDLPRLQPYVDLVERMGRLLRALESGPCETLTIELGSASGGESRLMIAATLKGFLSAEVEETITLVNAAQTAAERHLKVATVDRSNMEAHTATIALEGQFGKKKRRIVGVAETGRTPKITAIDEFPLDLIPSGRVLIFTNQDRPGVIGAAGVVLGRAKINIASWVLGRRHRGGTALGIVTVDDPVPAAVIRELSDLPHMADVVQVTWDERENAGWAHPIDS